MRISAARTKFGVGLVALSFAVGAAAFAVQATWGGDGGVAAERVEMIDQFEARWEIETAALEIVSVRLLEDAGIQPPDPTLIGSAVERLEAARERLDALAAAGVSDAEIVAEVLDLPGLDDPMSGDMFDVWDSGYYAREPGPIVEPETTAEVLHELSFAATLPYHIVVETLPLVYEVQGVELSGWSEEFVPEVADLVRDEESWIVPNADPLLSGSLWFDMDAARAAFPEELERIEDRFAGDPLLAYDAWSNDQTAPIPDLDPAAALAAATSLSSDVRAIVDQLVDEVTADDRAAAAAAATRSDRAQLISIVLGLLAACAMVVGVALIVTQVRRSSKRLAVMATTDALTGVGTRHELEQRTRSLVADPTRTHHAVAIIDLDRFKMVNDLHGHAAGDALLVTIGRGLRELVAELSGGGVEGTVIRLGGDEFLVSLHGHGPVDVDGLRRGLDQLRSESVPGPDGHLMLEFSFGLASGGGDVELSDLMADADLLVYENKADRAAARQEFGRFSRPKLVG